MITAVVIMGMSLLQVVRRDIAPLCTMGVIAANVLTKALKLLLQRLLPPVVWERPTTSSRDSATDPGFPSSHTTIMTFVSVYFAWYLYALRGWGIEPAGLLATVPSVLMACARVWDEDHTAAQTAGGLACGLAMGLGWAAVVSAWGGAALERGEPMPWAMVAVCFAVGLPMFCKPLRKPFASKGLTFSLQGRRWAEGLKLPQQ